MNSHSNKELVLEFYKKVFTEHDSQWVVAHVIENYIQHSPHLPTGRSALLQAVDYLKQLPKSNSERPSFFVIEEGDYVAVLWYAVIAGKRKAIADLFRIEQGRLAEHWDAAEESNEEPMYTVSGQNDDVIAARKAASELITQRERSAKIIRTIIERNVAMIQARVSEVGEDHVLYTFISINDNKVTDFRQVKQRIPGTMPHKNGMI